VAKNPALEPYLGKPVKAEFAERYGLVPPNPSSAGGAAAAVSGAALAKAIKSGVFPPTVLGTRITQYNKPAYDELAKSGYDLTTATLDYYGVQRWLSTLNNAQQTRLRQAIDATQSQLGLIRDYNQQLQKLVPKGQIGVLNKGSLLLAVNGAYGKEAGVVAKKMADQMGLVSTELAQVMSGGYSPLDKALAGSSAMLKSSSPTEQIVGTLDNLDRDLGYRRNSIYAPPITPSNPTGQPGQFNIGERQFQFGGEGAGYYGQGESGGGGSIERWGKDANGNIIRLGGPR
jgi:hypothetical protein